MQRDCAIRITGRGRLALSSVEYKTGKQSLFECARLISLRKEKTKEGFDRVRSRHLYAPCSSSFLRLFGIRIDLLEAIEPVVLKLFSELFV
ncbi:hypothetical protein TNCV_738361 [Trichonephila clavipes]|nr:hypothetical protein TNCV_738361 [Trichonephila clavipes]